MNENRINKTKKFGAEKHKGQKRKFGGKPYFTHPTRVADMIEEYTNDEDMIIAAYLHDTIEDTATTYDEILKEFVERVANLVKELTTDKNAAAKLGKAVYLTEKINKMSNEALTIKLCDRLDNLSGWVNEPEDFVMKYKTQTEYILNNLKRSLSSIHKKLIKEIQRILNLIPNII